MRMWADVYKAFVVWVTAMKKSRFLINAHVLLMVGIVVYALLSYSSLPEKYAAHFTTSGRIDRWADKGGVEYWILPAAALVAGMLFLISLKYPRHYNYPRKDRVNRWPEWRRIPVYEKLVEMMMVVAILVDILLLSIQIAIVNSSAGEMNFSLIGVLGPAAALPAVFIIYTVKISRIIDSVEQQIKISGALSESPNA